MQQADFFFADSTPFVSRSGDASIKVWRVAANHQLVCGPLHALCHTHSGAGVGRFAGGAVMAVAAVAAIESENWQGTVPGGGL